MFLRLLILALAVFAPMAAHADLPEGLLQHFKPLSGVIVMPIGDAFILDVDASSGAAEGDLFAIVSSGEKIVHPVTGEVLGTLDEVRAILQVTQLKSGYSYATPVGKVGKIERGDTIRRFTAIPALFRDETGGGATLYTELRTALPDLQWQSSGEALLTFVLKGEVLSVHGPSNSILHTYTFQSVTTSPESSPLAERLAALERLVAEGAAPLPPPSGPLVLEPPQPAGANASFQASFPGFKNLADLSQVVVTTDFLPQDDETLLATSDGESIMIYSVGDKTTLQAEGDSAYAGRILSLAWWQPQDSGPLYLAASIFSEDRPASTLFSFDGKNLAPFAENISYFTGTFDLDGDGRRETLLGQSFAPETFYGVKIVSLGLKGEDLDPSPCEIALPQRFTVTGSVLADLTGDGRPEAAFVRNGILYIYSDKEELYRSPKTMGGSLSVASYEENPGARDSTVAYATAEAAPLLGDLDGDGTPELLVTAAERSWLSSGSGGGVKKSWIAVFKHRDGIFVKGQFGDDLDQPLQGIGLHGDSVLAVLTRPATVFGKNGGSNLLALPIKQ